MKRDFPFCKLILPKDINHQIKSDGETGTHVPRGDVALQAVCGGFDSHGFHNLAIKLSRESVGLKHQRVGFDSRIATNSRVV